MKEEEIKKEIEDKRLEINMLYTDEEFKRKLDGYGVNFIDDLFNRFSQFVKKTNELEVLKTKLKVTEDLNKKFQDALKKLEEEIKKDFKQLNDQKDNSINIDTILWEVESEFNKIKKEIK